VRTTYAVEYRWDDDNGERWNLYQRNLHLLHLEKAEAVMREGMVRRPGIPFRVTRTETVTSTVATGLNERSK
jgi:hypothetical protein